MQDRARVPGVSGESGGAVLPVRLPDPGRVFARRAARFHALAPGHPIGDFLDFLGRLAEAQDHAAHTAAAPAPVPLAGPKPLSPSRWPRDESWRIALGAIIVQMRQGPLTPESASVLERLASAAPADLETRADAVLARDASRLDAAMTPIVAAALQVYWTSLASHADFGALELSSGSCPLCGSPPLVGLVSGPGGARYLVCPLCATEWRFTRLTCSACGDGSRLSYFALDRGPAGVKAETCGVCQTYLKLFYLEELPSADAVADDVTSVALDLLMAQEGYLRAGANWLIA